MWVDYWGAKGYVGPPCQIIGGGLAPPAPPPPPHLFLRFVDDFVGLFCGSVDVIDLVGLVYWF